MFDVLYGVFLLVVCLGYEFDDLGYNFGMSDKILYYFFEYGVDKCIRRFIWVYYYCCCI